MISPTTADLAISSTAAPRAVHVARAIVAGLVLLTLAACASGPPDPMRAWGNEPARVGPVVASANPLVTEAGMAVLARGGSAVDAAVAMQAVLGLVEPQSSGLGGGAFLMHYSARTGEVTAYDGRETAPGSAGPDLFLENGEPMNFQAAVTSGRSTGAPGVIPMLEMAQKAHGTLPWAELFADAERLADQGFVVSPRLANFISSDYAQARGPAAQAYFSLPDGRLAGAGDVLTNPAYAASLRAVAAEGAAAMQSGPIADAIVREVQADPRPGGLTRQDLAAYRPLERGALCRTVRVYLVCVPPPPSSGVAVLQFLEMAEHAPDLAEGPQSADAWIAFGRLQRAMYADRDRYVGDPAFTRVPVQGLLDEDYAEGRAGLALAARDGVEAGNPPGGVFTGPDRTLEPAGTSHFVVVDGKGDAVSMTTTVESLFGSGRMAAGFFLNNQLTDFSWQSDQPSAGAQANAPAGGKRPRSSMSPVIIVDTRTNRLAGAVGSPGGSAILAYNLKALVGVLYWDLSMQQAIDLPNLVARGEMVGADTDAFSPAIRQALAAAGLELRPNASENSGLHAVWWRGTYWDGGADPRREGVVAGARVVR